MVSTLDAIQHMPLNQRTYRRLRAFVLSGAIGMGERLDENALARQLGVSRTPMREAIGKLAQEGLVEYRPFQGNFVRVITVAQVRELFEVRRNLEGLAARLAVANVTDDDVRDLAAILDDVQAAFDTGDMEQYAVADRRFHAAIARLSGNATLVELLDQLSARIQLARVIANRDPHVVERTIQERPQILRAMQERDADAAQRLLENHIQGVLDALSHCLPDASAANEPNGANEGGLKPENGSVE
ncbi:MAG TPA: GntR family transcriptional regulator [Thermomicrobiales bacterium]|nr:GntR family transcriptional regulator [Thermomicrobiales bacterium]